MSRPSVGITGATGFVGASLAHYLADNGFRVVALTRRMVAGFEHRHYDLEQPIPNGLLQEIDILIHCAFLKLEQNKNARRLNYEGTKNLLLEANRCGVQKRIFFSTVSAHEEALSEYGKSKFHTESLFGQSDVILQCSLIMGPGGLFKQLVHYALSLRIVPLLEAGRQPLQVIAIQDVQKSVLTIITTSLSGKFVLANNEQLTYRQFFNSISRVYGKRFLFVPLPLVLIKLTTIFAEKINLNLPFNREQVYGLKALKMFSPSDTLAKLELKPMTLEEVLLKLKSGVEVT